MAYKIKALDNEQEDLKFLGVFSIVKESFKITLTWPKIFIQIMLAFFLPQACLSLANVWISKLLIRKITSNLLTLAIHKDGSSNYNNISHSNSSIWVIYWLINGVHFILSTVLSILIISVVVYTVAYLYVGKEITFKKILSVIPKVWKRLMITFLCNFCIMFAFMFVLLLVVIIPMIFSYKLGDGKLGVAIIVFIIASLLIVGLFYLTMIWQLANVVSVLEKNCGFKALKKSKELIKGKLGTAFGISLGLSFCGVPYFVLFKKLDEFGIVAKICFGIPSLVLLWAFFTLFGLVVQTVFYLVCKSYHHERIDKSSLADHLDAFLGEYVPLKNEDVQYTMQLGPGAPPCVV